MRDRNSWRRWRRVFGRDPRSDVDEELRDHIEQRVRDYVGRGMDPQSARRAALERIGDIERVKNECVGLLAAEGRAEERRALMIVSWLDVKLGLRMLAKYPGLTVIGGFAMAIAVAIALGYAAVLDAWLTPVLPFPGGERVVAIHNLDPRTGERSARVHDFVAWREGLQSAQNVGAFRTVVRNAIAADGSAEPVSIAEMSAAGFRVAGVQPLLGRYFLDEDEREGASPVVVIGHDAWRSRFASDPAIVGRELRLGAHVHTVVGVMPKGFMFPLNHQFWTPLSVQATGQTPAAGPGLIVFGTLAAGVDLAEAGSELVGLGERMAPAFPETHAQLRPRVLPYTKAFSDDGIESILLRASKLLAVLLLVGVCVNVAVLVYARTAVRHSEILVRTALGASRHRVVAQLFAEALVLAGIAAAAGVVIAAAALDHTNTMLARYDSGQIPFWMRFSLSADTVVFATSLTVLGAVITGVVPALKITGRRLQSGLQQLSAGGSGIALGRAWTTMIVGQVAIAIGALPTAVLVSETMFRGGIVDPGYDAAEYVSAEVFLESEAGMPPDVRDARYANLVSRLVERLRAEPDVNRVTFAEALPGEEHSTYIDVEGVPRLGEYDYFEAAGPKGYHMRHARVDVGYFAAFNVPLLAGRSFTTAEADTSAPVVIVSESFSKRFFGDGSAIGRRIRFAPNEDSTAVEPVWREIVGVVSDFPDIRASLAQGHLSATLYQPARPDQIYPVRLAIHAPGPATLRLASRARTFAAGVDPVLQLHDATTIAAAYDRQIVVLRAMGVGVAAVTASVLLLSAAGIYAMMSVAVTRRRREIGIRTALGATPRRILASVFRRSGAQLAGGIVVGLGAAALLDRLVPALIISGVVVVPIAAAIVLGVGLLASFGPARRGLRIPPTEVLKQE